MAKLKVEGLAGMEEMLRNHEKAATEALPEMLKAGAKVLVEAEKQEISRMGLVDTGDMRKSVKAAKEQKTSSGGFVDVYPHGKDRKGVRNAEKGFIAQYGKSGQPARPWVTSARAKAEQEVQAAMKETWEKKQNG